MAKIDIVLLIAYIVPYRIFVNGEEETKRLSKALKVGKWFKFRGYTKNDPFSKELVLNARDILKIEKEENVIFAGRLAKYKYYNMDLVVKDALEIFEKEIK